VNVAVTFRAKLVATHVALALLVIAAITIAIDRAVGAHFTAQVERRLEKQARGAVPWLTTGRHPERIATRLAPLVEARVTILDGTGGVLADSEYPLSMNPAVPNQLGAPEVAAAVRRGLGRTIRSDEQGRTTLFLALRVAPDRILRLGAPLSDVMSSLAELRRLIFVAAGVACAIALVLGLLAARIGTRPLRAMQRAAHQIARGSYDVAVATTARDDFGRLSRDLAQLAAQLRARETMRRDFVANVSHELRTPVTAIRGYSETLLDPDTDVDDATRREFVVTIQRNAQRIGRLVDDLLRLAELEARPAPPARDAVPLAPIVDRAVATARARTPGGRASVDVRVGADVVALGDAHAIEQIVLNLVDNALRYGGSRVTIEARPAEGRVALGVSDDGPGIAPEHLPRLFERFYRVDPGRSRETGGTGLGLAIARHLAESMDGDLGVESTVGAGTTFTLSLPIGDPRPAPPPP
jgi:signal transduction histidine kinase